MDPANYRAWQLAQFRCQAPQVTVPPLGGFNGDGKAGNRFDWQGAAANLAEAGGCCCPEWWRQVAGKFIAQPHRLRFDLGCRACQLPQGRQCFRQLVRVAGKA